MLQSKLFAKIKKTAPQEAEVLSHQLLLRADFIEQSFAGVYRFLPLGFKVLSKIEGIIRKEMESLEAQEVYLPALQNKNLWLETGRWEAIDPPLFKFKDRHEKEVALGSTHEEEITDIFRNRVSSYQDLPLSLFQIQNKFRNEMRATGGLLRTREFLMKDLYSFDADEADAKKFYEKVKASYFQIFEKCGLKALCVEADSGTIGGSFSNEFMVLSEIGEDRILCCEKCKSYANVEKVGEIKKCQKCSGPLKEERAVEVGHIFLLGDKYSKAMNAKYMDKDGKEKFAFMGCYGIGLPRLMAVAVEKNHDEKGIIWPKDIAPFDVHLLALSSNDNKTAVKIKTASEKLYQDLSKQGLEVLYDDRQDKTAGEKFVEADLIGIPYRIIISERSLEKNSAEVKERNKKEGKLVGLNSVTSYFKKS